MRPTIRRVVVVLAALASIALAGAGGVRAASPTPAPALGATVESRVYLADDRNLTVWNRSTVEARFDFEPSGGYTMEPASVVLEPDATATVAIVGDGDDGTHVNVVIRSTATPPPGATESVGVVVATIYHSRPFDPSEWIWRALAVAFAVAAVIVVARRGRQFASRYSIVRKEP